MSLRRFSVGAEPVAGGVHFRVWAPKRKRVAVVIDDVAHPLEAGNGGYFGGVVASACAGSRYAYQLDDDERRYPDPASRFQPEGPHRPSQVVDAGTYVWRLNDWPGIDEHGLVIEEIHIGTFTPEGTWMAAIAKLPLLADVGINVVEVLPIAEFPGSFGWGYDGVDLWAPSHLYGSPDDFRRFVDAAHANGLGVLLDVVYNHFGPDGCYLSQFSDDYFTSRHQNDWGEAIDFDGPGSEGVRDFFADNAAYWISEFHLDGLRFDATQSIHDTSDPHILAVLARRCRTAAASRKIVLVAENEPQEVVLVERYGITALWNDDWHHAARVALTGEREAYYTDYCGQPQEFVSMARHGFLYQGQWYGWQKNRRGTPSLDLDAWHLVCYLENHDQVANSARGERLCQITSPGKLRALTALLLLAPQTPMLFQGQEFGSTAPFLYFADHEGELAAAVASGRRDFLAQFPSIRPLNDSLAPPHDRSTFRRSQLDWSEREQHAEWLALHRDLIALRRSDGAFAAQRRDRLEGAVLSDSAFLLRWHDGRNDDRLLLVNLGPALHLDPVAQPLLAPPAGKRWRLLWTSDAKNYGGDGSPEPDGEEDWTIPEETAVVMEVLS